MDVAEIVANTLRRNGGEYVSFAELQRDATAYEDNQWSGDYAMEVKPGSNIFIWFGMSPDAIAAIDSLIKRKVVDLVPSSEMVYMVDGIMANAPIAKQARNYKKPRWMPVTLYRGDNWDDLP
ncbi:MAG: hypothetical protein QG597_1265 [Actinomycetota bacterium]|nr:hypothetical protein [Actinomycetota bacterium]